jgi:valyl-tRNA synthetase
MKPLAAPAIEANEQGRVRFHPRRFNDVYLSWMRNIRDWCISRQIWLGHSIPVSTCANGHRFAWIEPPTACEVCGNAQLTNDPDVLDTWFSSALWPFAIFGWPDDTEDLRRFYTTDVLGTAREIIFLWVARMVMTGLRFMEREPFHDVIINSTILAVDGSRMSKSKGNAIDPVLMVERYGADAVRAWAGAVGTSGQDVRFDEDRIASYQRFANKLWNVTRFLMTRLGEGGDVIQAPRDVPAGDLAAEDRWMLARLAETVDACDSGIEQYRFHDAMERLYDTTWHAFCDWYVEMSKSRLRDGAACCIPSCPSSPRSAPSASPAPRRRCSSATGRPCPTGGARTPPCAPRTRWTRCWSWCSPCAPRGRTPAFPRRRASASRW